MSSAAFLEKKDWAYPHKSAEAFRTISEVAIELDVPQHVLRCSGKAVSSQMQVR